MECGYTSAEPGDCPMCNIPLVESGEDENEEKDQSGVHEFGADEEVE
jgi:hypothetical protein